jgi:hypothetical protein
MPSNDLPTTGASSNYEDTAIDRQAERVGRFQATGPNRNCATVFRRGTAVANVLMHQSYRARGFAPTATAIVHLCHLHARYDRFYVRLTSRQEEGTKLSRRYMALACRSGGTKCRSPGGASTLFEDTATLPLERPEGESDRCSLLNSSESPAAFSPRANRCLSGGSRRREIRLMLAPCCRSCKCSGAKGS